MHLLIPFPTLLDLITNSRASLTLKPKHPDPSPALSVLTVLFNEASILISKKESFLFGRIRYKLN